MAPKDVTNNPLVISAKLSFEDNRLSHTPDKIAEYKGSALFPGKSRQSESLEFKVGSITASFPSQRNLAVETTTTGRTYPLGQNKNMIGYCMITTGILEEKLTS